MAGGRGGLGRKLVGLLVVLAVLAALGAAGLYLVRANSGPSQSDSKTTTFDEAITTLDFSGDDADISVSVGDKAEVTKTFEWRGEDKPSTRESVSGKTLKVEHQGCEGFEFFAPNGCSAKYDVTVPAETKLDLVTGSGGIETSGFAGDQSIEINSGDVDIAEATGNLKMTGDSGDINGEELSAARTELNLDSGDATLKYAKAPEQIKASNDSGGVNLTVPDDGETYQVDAQVDSGNKDVSVPESGDASRKIAAVSDSGDLEIRT